MLASYICERASFFFSAVFKALNGFWNFAIRLFVQFINDAFWWQQTIYSILFSHAMIKYQAISKMLSKINALQDNNHLFIYLFYLLQQARKWKKKTHTPSVCFACLLCFAIRFLFYFISICSRWHEQQNQNEWKKNPPRIKIVQKNEQAQSATIYVQNLDPMGKTEHSMACVCVLVCVLWKFICHPTKS